MWYFIKKWFKKKREHIWKEIKCEYLRRDGNLYVYATTSICILTNKTKISEEYSWTPRHEYDISIK